jgi:serine-type D-Ala-D-Ala carboxypeptidase/endopeptidase
VTAARVELGFAGAPGVDASTLFEFGSLTKVLTANLVVQLAHEGRWSLEDAVYDHLPEPARAAQWKRVTLRHVLTHTAGVPRLPPDLHPLVLLLRGRIHDPYARHTREHLVRAVRRVKLRRPGAWRYSNLGFAILGLLLEHLTGVDYEELLRTRILTPLGMHDAGVAGWSSPRIAPPLGPHGRATAHWNLAAFASAGGLRGSLHDGVRLLSATMHACESDSAFARAACAGQAPIVRRDGASGWMGLGWIVEDDGARRVVWHNGGTGGYTSVLACDPVAKRGVVLLANRGLLTALDGIAMSALEPPPPHG